VVTSYNGWVASPNPAAIDIDTNWSVLGSRPFSNGGFPGGVKAGAVSVIFTYLVTRLHNEVEPMMTGPAGEIGYGCWGYGYRANVNNPSVLSCHACLTADTPVVTRDGVTPIGKLAGGYHDLLVRDPLSGAEVGEWRSALVSQFADEETFLITMHRGVARRSIRATASHRWFVDRRTSRYAGNYRSTYAVQTSERTTTDLRPGDRLTGCLPPPKEVGLSPDGVMHGVVFGDGTRLGRTTMVRLWGPKVALDEWFPAVLHRTPKALESGVSGVEVRGLPGGYKELPSLTDPIEYLAGWLAGYLATDGSIGARGDLTLSSRDPEHLSFAATVAARIGVAARGPSRVGAGGGYRPDSVQYGLTFVRSTVPAWLLIRDDQRAMIGETHDVRARGWVVDSVAATGEVEPTYCATVPGVGAFTLGDWLLTGNSGTAIDYNAPRHPNGTVAPGGGSGWTTAQAEKIRGIIADLGGVVRWLWSNDPMHFEIIGSSAQCAVVAARIRREPAKPNPPSTNPSTPSNPPAPGDDEWWFDMATPEQRQQFKEMVHEALTWWAEEGPQSGIDPVLLRGAVRGAIINAADGRDPELLQAIKEIVRDGAMWARNDAQDAPDQAGK